MLQKFKKNMLIKVAFLVSENLIDIACPIECLRIKANPAWRTDVRCVRFAARRWARRPISLRMSELTRARKPFLVRYVGKHLLINVSPDSSSSSSSSLWLDLDLWPPYIQHICTWRSSLSDLNLLPLFPTNPKAHIFIWPWPSYLQYT